MDGSREGKGSDEQPVDPAFLTRALNKSSQYVAAAAADKAKLTLLKESMSDTEKLEIVAAAAEIAASASPTTKE